MRYTVTPTANGCPGIPIIVDIIINPLPVCDISGPDNICPSSTNIYSTTTGAGHSYLWTIAGNGTIVGSATGPNVSVLSNNSCGVFTLTVLTTLNGCTCTTTRVFNVSDNTPPTWTTTDGTLNVNLGCTDAAGLAAAQGVQPFAIDNCGPITYSKTSGAFVGNVCGGSYTNTWIARDVCSNASSSFTQIITISPATLPTMTAPAASAAACGDAFTQAR